MGFEQFPFHDTFSSYAQVPPPYRRYFGIDESGSMKLGKDCIVLGFIRDKPGSIVPRPQRKKLRYGGLRDMRPFGDFGFLVLTPEMLEIAQDIFSGPTTANDVRLGGLYYQFKLRSWAVAHLLDGLQFNPWTDLSVVDAYGNDGMRHNILYALSRKYERHVPEECVLFVNDADQKIPVVMNADTNALLVKDSIDDFEYARVPITNDDIARFGLEDMRFTESFPCSPGPTWH